jgi:hypothetical protein
LGAGVIVLARHAPAILNEFDEAERQVALRAMIGLVAGMPKEAVKAAVARREDQSVLDHLLSSSIAPPGSRDRRSFAVWIEAALSTGPAQPQAANLVLHRCGLAVILRPAPALVVSSSHDRLMRLFAGTPWARRRHGRQPLVLALRQIPGARAIECHRFGKASGTRATAIPLPLSASAHSNDEKGLSSEGGTLGENSP